MRYLGIDYGLKKIGLAIGDDEVKIASPFEVIPAKGAIEKILKIFDEERIDALVVGVPKKVGNFHSNEQLKLTEEFIEKLKSEFGVEVYQINESYTSKESQRLQKEQGAIAEEDALSAMLILQEYLDNC